MCYIKKYIKSVSLLLIGIAIGLNVTASRIFIPMDADNQANHLKAYGVAFAALKYGMEVDWLLNYKGGSFGINQTQEIERLCKLRGVSYEVITEAAY